MDVQDHIHLDMLLGAAPEYAPPLKWTVVEKLLVPSPIMQVNETLTGTLKVHRLRREGTFVKRRDMKYRIKIGDGIDSGGAKAQLDSLFGMLGEDVYLVEHWHPDDGQNHTNYVRPMVLIEISPPEFASPLLNFLIVDISLKDDQFR